MTKIESLFGGAKGILLNHIPAYWKEMEAIGMDFTSDELLPELITPAACCKAVGGAFSDTYDICAAILAAEISVRVLDDLEDGDKPDALYRHIGPARALNYVDAFRTVAYKILTNKCNSDHGHLKIMEAFTDCYLVVLAGQDRDLKSQIPSLEEGWKTIEMKTGYIYATIAAMGAMAGTNNEEWIDGCKRYGYHLGLAIQLFNDMDGIWSPEGISDLEQGKITIPLLYAMHFEHPAKVELTKIVHQNSIAKHATSIKHILDQIDAKSYLIWAALKQRESALASIDSLPENEGKELLEAHFTGMFGDIDQLLATDTKLRSHLSESFDTLQLTRSTLIDKDNLNSESVSTGLNLRRKLRKQYPLTRFINGIFQKKH